jgi:hypothetical protein
MYMLWHNFVSFQLKAVELNSDLQILHETAVQFDSDLPEFRWVWKLCVHGRGSHMF